MNNRQKAIGKFIARRQGKDPDEVLRDFSSTTKERIASCSKWLSAALVMSFVDEGKLSLDDSIGKYLPVMTANKKGNIKIWQCLSHLTGIKSGSLKDSRELITGAENMDDAINAIATQPMEGEPGKTFHYSSAGLQIVAAIIEKIGKKDFETLFNERIAQPCNMKNTDFGKGKVPLAAGSAWSTAEDYINFLSMILNEGIFNGKRVLSKNAITEMQKNRVNKNTTIKYTPAEAGSWGYGFGEWVMDDATGDKRSDGVTSPGLFGSFPWVDNKLQYAGFLFTFNINSKGRNERYKSLKKIIEDAITGK
jgi:CubicO group peptidase (beta-lactamase class C family)